MQNLINSFTRKVVSTPITTVFLAKNGATPTRLFKRHSTFPDHNTFKQQAHFTPIIELKPILGSPNHLDENSTTKKIISTDAQRRNPIVKTFLFNDSNAFLFSSFRRRPTGHVSFVCPLPNRIRR